MSTLHQVVRHTFTISTRKVETANVGKPCKRTTALALAAKYNEEESRLTLAATPENPHLTIISYSTVLAKSAPIHEVAS